jgi:predicted acetyltransferase
MDKYISSLDTERFGFRVAKINDFEGDPETITSQLKNAGVKLIISRVKSNETRLINNLEDIGFRVKDSQVTYRYDLSKINTEIFNFKSELAIRAYNEKDLSQMVCIAEESFQGYGHYFADDRLNKNVCLEIYKDWIWKSCTDRKIADKIFVAETNGEIMGFLSFKINKDNNKEEYAVGGIGAVSRRFRNKGVFPAIVKKGLIWGKETGLIWEEHNVITSNFPVNCVFSKIGFRIVESYLTLHCWQD